MRTIASVIVKPTKACNADCTYCAAPPDGEPVWKWLQYTQFIDAIADSMIPGADLIWHGGEPMLMGAEFYRQAHEYAKSKIPDVKFSMQSNLILYRSQEWRDVFREIFEGRVSTSYDIEERDRTIKGDPKTYGEKFWAALEAVLNDGFHPMVIGTYTDFNKDSAFKMYERALAYKETPFNLRFNYRFPAGLASGRGPMITPRAYGKMLIDLFDRWIVECPDFSITPLDQMLSKVIGMEAERCPWSRGCGGRIIGVEPNGDVYNCSEFADLGNEEYRFGNIFQKKLTEILKSQASVLIRRRRVNIPVDCVSCRHFNECEGGCMRDAVLFDRGLGGKFYYCQSWMMVFDRIKQAVANGEAQGVIQKHCSRPNGVLN